MTLPGIFVNIHLVSLYLAIPNMLLTGRGYNEKRL